MTADVVIAGAGIVGAAIADLATSEGLRVVVVEPNVVGGGATAAGMGHIVVMDDSEAQFALTACSRAMWGSLAPELPVSVEFEARGTLWAAVDEEEMRAVHSKREFYESRSIAVEVLDARQLAEAEPCLRPGLVGALRVKDDVVLYSPAAARWLVDRACSRGARLLGGKLVTASAPGEVRLDDGSRISAERLVNATGAGAPRLTPGIAVRPRKGHLAITDRYPGFLRHQIVELGYLKSAHGHAAESVACNLQPRATGQVLIGSSRQYDVDDPAVEPRMLAQMLQRSIEYSPSLGRLSVIRSWTGFRAATPDGLPLIGPAVDSPNVLLATGHEGLGITTSLATADLIVASIMGRAPAIAASPYLPSRFASGAGHGHG